MLKIILSMSLLLILNATSWAQQYGGDASGRTFAEACAGDIGAERKATYFAEMDKADAALAAGNVERAGAATLIAQSAVFRGGSYADDTSIRCLGTEAMQRWFDTHLELWRRGASYGLEGRPNDFGTMVVIANDRGAQGLIDVATGRPVTEFRNAYYAIQAIIDRDDWRREFGSPLLPGEKAVAKASRDAMGPLEEFRQQEIVRALAAEDEAFDRPPTAEEQQAAEQIEQFGSFATAMAGAGSESEVKDHKTLMLLGRRIDESWQYINVAHDLEWGSRASGDKTRAMLRAEQRGGILLARANDESRSLETRDTLYEEARRYFDFCDCNEKRRTTNTARDAIQPALEEQAARREAALEQKQEELRRQAEGMQKAVDDMKKSEAEKKEFEDEADALEAELGF